MGNLGSGGPVVGGLVASMNCHHRTARGSEQVKVSRFRVRFSNTVSIGLCCNTPSISEEQDFYLSMAIDNVRVVAIDRPFISPGRYKPRLFLGCPVPFAAV